jgi:hypothetical protein
MAEGDSPMPGAAKSQQGGGNAPAAVNPEKPASLIEDDNMRAAARGLPGGRAALPPGSLPEQTPDSQGDQNMEPVIPPGPRNPRPV